GQFLPTNTLTNSVDVTLVSDYTKFAVTVVRTGPSTFHLISNGSLLGVEAHRMSSDGLLICHELASYMTYCHEDAQGYRTVINNRTMAFSKETDPSVLRQVIFLTFVSNANVYLVKEDRPLTTTTHCSIQFVIIVTLVS
ncbi:Acetyl-CoA carboxylase, partial [Fasciola gigantica]